MITSKTIEIIALGKDQASKVLSGVGSSVAGLGSVAAGVATGGLALAAAAIVGLGVAAVGTALAVTSLAFAAAEVEGTRRTFEALTGDLGGSTKAMDAMREATRGMVGQADLMAASNKFLAMGLTDTIEGTADMAEMATQLGMAMGMDATKSMEDFALMLANTSIPRMDSFGLSSGIARVRIKELMEATEGMTREEAFAIAAWEQGIVVMERVGEQGESATATTLRWKAAIADLKLGIGQAFIPALEAIRGPALALVDEYGPKIIAWAEVAGDWLAVKIPEAIAWLEGAWAEYWPKITGYVSEAWEKYSPFLIGTYDWLKVKIPDAIAWLGKTWAEWWPKISGAVKDPMGTIEGLFESLSGWLKDKIPVQLAVVQTTWTVAWDAIMAVADVFVDVVWPILQDAFASLTDTLAILGLDWTDVWEAIKRATKITAIIIGAIILGLIAVFTGIITAIARVAEHVARVLADMAATFRLAMKAIENILTGFFNIIIGIFTGDMGRIKEGWDQWLTGMGQAFQATWEGIKNAFSLIVGTILTIISGFTEGVYQFFARLYDRLVGHSIVKDMMDRLKSIFSDGLERVKALVLGWKDKLVGLFQGLVGAMEPIRHWIIVIRDAFQSALWVFNEVRHWIDVLVEKFNHFKTSLSNFQLPWWLTPGSPTPLETGLVGIGKALAGVQGLAGGGLSFGGMSMAGASAGAGGGVTTIQIINHFGPGSVRDDQDIMEIADAITQNLELRGAGRVL